MVEPNTPDDHDHGHGHGHDMPPTNGSSMEPRQDHLVADELPLSEEDYALAMQSSRSLLRQTNNRRRLSQHRHPHVRQRPRTTSTPASRSVEKLAQGLDRQKLQQSTLRPCVNSRCISATTPSRPSSTRTWELDPGKPIGETTVQREARPEHGQVSIPTAEPSESAPETSKSMLLASREHTSSVSTSTESSSIAQREAESFLDSKSRTLLIADSDEDMDEDEGFFEGTDDLLHQVEDSNKIMDILGAYRRRGLLWFRRSTEAASTSRVVVRNVPRIRRRKEKKMEVRQRATTISDDNSSSRGANTAIV